MHEHFIRILMVEDNPGDVDLVRESLAQAGSSRFSLTHAGCLAEAADLLAGAAIDVVLLDLSLPDGHGLQTVSRIKAAAPKTPIVVLTSLNDEALGMEIVHAGVQDYLVKGDMDGKLLVRSMRYAIERKRAQEALRQAHDQLEKRVQERTADLAKTNDVLRAQNAERRHAEEALRESRRSMEAVVETAPSLILVADQTGRIILFNRACEELTGYQRAEVLDRTVADLHLPPAWMDLLQQDDLAPETLEACGPHEHTWKIKSGEERLIEWRCTSFFSARPGSCCLLAAGVDITERKRLEAQLRRWAEDLAEADRRKDEFLAMLAHELRNPLAPVRTGLEIIRMRGHDRLTLARARDMMERQVVHMTRLVDDLLDVSRITRGKIQLQKELVSLTCVVERAVEASRPLIDSRHHGLTVQLPPEPVRLEADPVRLAQILGNLLNNAAKYTEAGGRISLTAERDGSSVVLHIRDTGIGITSEMLPHIFDLFTQAHHSLDRSQGGLGIGLTLVRKLVQMHGGSVSAYSAGMGHGSEFVVRLPASAEPPMREDRSISRGAGTDAGGAPCRILVVDDNQDSAQSLGILLNLWGYDTRIVHNGLEALETADQYQPDVVLLDLGLPGMDGYQVARKLREEPPTDRALLVAITGYGQAEDRLRACEAGFDYHLVKPVEPERLQELLGQSLARPVLRAVS